MNALSGLDRVAKGVGKFEQGWHELVKTGLPSCWDSMTAAFSSLTNYEEKMATVMNQTNLPYEKMTRLKADTIIAALGKEISLLCQFRQCLTVQVDYSELTDMQASVEIFATIPFPAAAISQKCSNFANVPAITPSIQSPPPHKKKTSSFMS